MRAKGPAGWILVGAVRVYQYTLSPLFYALGVRCRHEPSCSAYAVDAIRAQGAWRGSWLAAGRVARCRPGGSHGYDPAPENPTDVPFWAIGRFRERARTENAPGTAKDEDR